MSEEMTREQAIDYFRTQIAYLGGKDKQACEIAILAIAALSAEPCEDAISRQAVLGLAYDMSEIDGEHFTEPCMVVDVEDIQKLPPVTPKQRTGHWIIISPTDMYCSECNEIERLDTSRRFCAYCGTRMSENPTGSESEERS